MARPDDIKCTLSIVNQNIPLLKLAIAKETDKKKRAILRQGLKEDLARKKYCEDFLGS